MSSDFSIIIRTLCFITIKSKQKNDTIDFIKLTGNKSSHAFSLDSESVIRHECFASDSASLFFGALFRLGQNTCIPFFFLNITRNSFLLS